MNCVFCKKGAKEENSLGTVQILLHQEGTLKIWKLYYLRVIHCSEEPQGSLNSGLPKVIFLAIAKSGGKGEKSSALKVEAKGKAKGLVFCI